MSLQRPDQVDSSSLISQMNQMREEIEALKGLRIVLEQKDKTIYTLEKKIRHVSQERNKLKFQLSSTRAGGVGG
jgi:predicted RNase H-like nuclease (RuvC/YqgF family)